jgi:putative nucleotidyltransferase with HDIG domain
MNKNDALALLRKYNESESLIKHGLAVAAVMGYYARKLGEDEEYWECVGLLHDVDYGQFPQEHCKKAPELLAEIGADESFVHAVVCHGWGMCSDVEPQSTMEKILYTIDELTGLVTAAVYMRPGRTIEGMELKSLKKKFKTASFAAGVNREVIKNGCQLLGWELDEVMSDVLKAMTQSAVELGLAG